MRFMAMVITDAGSATTTQLPTEAQIGAMGRFNEELHKAGILLDGVGLHPTSKGARVTLKEGKREVTDGPFSEAREVVGGYWILDVRNKGEAIEWMKRVPFFHDAVVEIRQIQEPEDFAPSEAIEREKALGKKLAAEREARGR